MIDINFIKQNPEEAKAIFKKRGCQVDVDEFLKINNEFNSKKALVDKLKFEQKNLR
jgi:seryl-tRNA synthetase